MVYVKLTTKDRVHNGYQYKEGLNCLEGKFNSDNICAEGGLYFCDEKDIGKWVNYGNKVMHYIWDVTLFDDSKLVVMGDKLKTDKFIIQNKRTIWDDNGLNLRYVVHQTEELCKLAVQEFVKDQTEEICKLAVRQNGHALKYVDHQTDKICKLAVQQDGFSLEWVKNQTDEICKLAVRRNGHALESVKNKPKKYAN